PVRVGAQPRSATRARRPPPRLDRFAAGARPPYEVDGHDRRVPRRAGRPRHTPAADRTTRLPYGDVATALRRLLARHPFAYHAPRHGRDATHPHGRALVADERSAPHPKPRLDSCRRRPGRTYRRPRGATRAAARSTPPGTRCGARRRAGAIRVGCHYPRRLA